MNMAENLLKPRLFRNCKKIMVPAGVIGLLRFDISTGDAVCFLVALTLRAAVAEELRSDVDDQNNLCSRL